MTTTPLSPRAAVALGLVVSGMGVLIALLAVGVIPGAEASLEAPRWVVASAGLAFVLAGAARLSIAFFNHPNYDTLIECLPSQGVPRHAPVLSGEYRDRKYAKTGFTGAPTG